MFLAGGHFGTATYAYVAAPRRGSGGGMGYPRCAAKPAAAGVDALAGRRLLKCQNPAQPMHADPPLPSLRDPRLAHHAVAAAPVWLWAADGTRVLWANAAGAAVLDAANPPWRPAQRRVA